MANCDWSGYSFTIYDPATGWNAKGGVYISAGLAPNGRWNGYYIGITDNFQSRLPNHERWAEAVRLGATHVHALVVRLQASREAIERQLIAAHGPPLNTQHRWP